MLTHDDDPAAACWTEEHPFTSVITAKDKFQQNREVLSLSINVFDKTDVPKRSTTF